MTGRRAGLEENNLFFIWPTYAQLKDVQCNTKESPYKGRKLCSCLTLNYQNFVVQIIKIANTTKLKLAKILTLY